MQLQPTFSIITITYNAVRLVEQTLLNVLSQSYPNIEYIVIDGGSTDGTADIIRRYESGLAYWVSEPDKGIYDAMNKGLQKATGDYVWFINAGDTLCSSDTVQSVVSKLQKRKALPDIIYGETNIVDEERRSLGLRRLRAPRKLSWKSFRMGMLVCHQSFIPKRAIAPSYDLQYRYSADFDWCIRCMKQARHSVTRTLPCPTSWTAGRARRKEKHPCGRDMRLCANIMVLLLRFCSTAGSPSVFIRRSA